MIRVLRLGNSDDTHPGVPDSARSYRVAEALLAEATGEDVETVVRRIWPDERLPGLVARWMDEVRPDIVYFRINSFWYNYESVPLKLQRSYGPIGRWVARWGFKAGETPGVTGSRLFRPLRRWAVRLVGSDTYFSPAEVAARVDQCLAAILAHEQTAVVVRGSRGERANRNRYPPAVHARRESRRREMSEALADVCARRHVFFVTRDRSDPARDDRRLRVADGFHKGPDLHRADGHQEGIHLIEAWHHANGREDPVVAATPGG